MGRALKELAPGSEYPRYMHIAPSNRAAARLRRVVVVVAVAMIVSTVGWLPAADGDSIPGTVAREVAVPLDALAKAPGRNGPQMSSAGILRSGAPAVTSPVTVCAPIQFTAVGLAWNQTSGADIQAVMKSGDRAGDMGPGTDVDSDGGEGPDVTSPEYHAARRSTALLWTGEARCIEFSLELPENVSMSGLRAVFINTSGTADGDPEATAGTFDGLFGTTPASAMTNRPALVSRDQWGADESLRNCDPYYAPKLKMAFVHHTAGSNDYSRDQSDDIVRSIYWYHTQVKGWCDIAYNFLVDRFGTVYVGRAGGSRQPTVPGATQGFNMGSTAVAAMGNFMDVAPSGATVSSIKRVLAWRLDIAHLPATGWARMVSSGGPNTRYSEGTEVWLRLISGHRRTGYTDCPGDRLNALLPEMRQVVGALGTPKILRPSQSANSITPGIHDVRVTAKASEALAWKVLIRDVNGKVVRRFLRRGVELEVTWDGRDELGMPVLPGDYTVTITGTNATGSPARRALLQVTVEPSAP